MTARRLRLFLIDDHSLFVQGLALLLSTHAADQVEVVGHCTHSEEAVSRLLETEPDVAVVDLSMPKVSGVDIIRAAKKRLPATRTVALTGTEDLELAESALRAGASGYLTKSAEPAVLLHPLLSVARGVCVLEPEMLDKLLAVSRRPPQQLLERLGAQDLRLWALVARGLETTDIAQRLLVSERTTKRMVSSLLNKIGAENRTEAAGLAGRYGLLDASSDATELV